MMTISVVLPTKNRGKDLFTTIDSIFLQTYLPRELIIIDQNISTEIKDAIFSKYNEKLEEKNITLKYIHNPQITGLTQAKNNGVENNESDIVLFLDDDVILEKDFIFNMIEIYKKYPDIYGISGIITNSKIGFMGKIFFKIFPLGDLANRSSLIETDPKYSKVEYVETSVIGGGLTSYKKEIFDEFKFDENFINYAIGEDLDFSFRVSRKYKLVITHRSRLIHNTTGDAGRPDQIKFTENKICSKYYFFRKNLDKNFYNYLSFIWLNIGYLVSSLYTLIRYQDIREVIGTFKGYKKIFKHEDCDFIKFQSKNGKHT